MRKGGRLGTWGKVKDLRQVLESVGCVGEQSDGTEERSGVTGSREVFPLQSFSNVVSPVIPSRGPEPLLCHHVSFGSGVEASSCCVVHAVCAARGPGAHVRRPCAAGP